MRDARPEHISCQLSALAKLEVRAPGPWLDQALGSFCAQLADAKVRPCVRFERVCARKPAACAGACPCCRACSACLCCRACAAACAACPCCRACSAAPVLLSVPVLPPVLPVPVLPRLCRACAAAPVLLPVLPAFAAACAACLCCLRLCHACAAVPVLPRLCCCLCLCCCLRPCCRACAAACAACLRRCQWEQLPTAVPPLRSPNNPDLSLVLHTQAHDLVTLLDTITSVCGHDADWLQSKTTTIKALADTAASK
jgi:hypothetical protein